MYKILVVCTANRCRSPMGEVLLHAALERRGISAIVRSAGFHESGIAADPYSRAAVTQRGLSLDSHRSSAMVRAVAEGADLILCMAAEHVQQVVATDPGAWSKTFTLREFVSRSETRRPEPDMSLPAWIVRLHDGRVARDLLRTGKGLDIADPIGQNRQRFERCCAEIESLCESAADLIALAN